MHDSWYWFIFSSYWFTKCRRYWIGCIRRAKLVTSGGCDLNKQECQVDISGLFCRCPDDTSMEGVTTWIVIMAFSLLSCLMIYEVKGAIF